MVVLEERGQYPPRMSSKEDQPLVQDDLVLQRPILTADESISVTNQ